MGVLSGRCRSLWELCLLTGSSLRLENILFLIGTGQNGKGVFGEAIQNMLGPGNYTSFSVERLVRSADKASNIASMNGVVCEYMLGYEQRGCVRW